MHVIADSAGGAWSFGGSILSFAFPMILIAVVAVALYVVYTKPEVVPGHRAPALERPVSYTAQPGKPAATPEGQAAAPEEQAKSTETTPDEAGEAAGTGDAE